MANGRAVVVGLAAVSIGLGGCRGKHERKPAGTGTGTGTGDAHAVDWCVKAIARAAAMAPLDRAGVIVRACALCGGSFDPLIAADGARVDVAGVAAVVDACATCSPTAVTAFREQLSDLGPDDPAITPWRTLAERCPAAMHADRDAGRFASGAWFALAAAGDRLAAARPTMADDVRRQLDGALADLVLTLPPRSATGNPLALPTGGAQPATPWLAISIVGDQLYLGPLPFARLTADGLNLIGAPVYPGATVLPSALAEAVAKALAAGPGFAVPAPPGRLDRPVILAPHGSPAARVLDVVLAVGDQPSYLAVASAAPASMWPGQLAASPVAMAARDPVHAPHLRVGLASGRVAAVDADGKVLASATLPGADRPTAARMYAAATAMAAGGIVEVAAETGTVDDLAALLDAALRASAAGVVPAPAGATVTGKPSPTFDGPALRALVAP